MSHLALSTQTNTCPLLWTHRFYGKAIFNDNINENLGYGQNQGGALRTRDGSDLM